VTGRKHTDRGHGPSYDGVGVVLSVSKKHRINSTRTKDKKTRERKVHNGTSLSA